MLRVCLCPLPHLPDLHPPTQASRWSWDLPHPTDLPASLGSQQNRVARTSPAPLSSLGCCGLCLAGTVLPCDPCCSLPARWSQK